LHDNGYNTSLYTILSIGCHSLKILNDCQKYALAINAKETPFLNS
jgi:hypothetical protein